MIERGDRAATRLPVGLIEGSLAEPEQVCGASAVERYYRVQARIYDATRWLFLFGRSEILRRVAERVSPVRILEIGCGTGRNIVELAHLFPQAHVTGVDLSAAMLERAQRKLGSFGDRVQLVHARYDRPLASTPTFDLVLFSYSLTMFNPGFDVAIEAARSDLVHGGCAAVLDFHDSRFRWFTDWMHVNHVRTEGQLLPAFQQRFAPSYSEVRHAYAGLWRYFLFLGK